MKPVTQPSLLLSKNLQASIAASQQLLSSPAIIAAFERAAAEVASRYRNGGRLYIAGNGGSAAHAQHLAAEFVCRLSQDRVPLPAEALTVDTSLLTAISNDYGFDLVFSRQIAAKMTSKDIFLALTTSGQSANILKALETCRIMNIPSVLFGGRDGGRARALADYCVLVPGEATSIIQELHIALAHALCEYVEQAVLEQAA